MRVTHVVLVPFLAGALVTCWSDRANTRFPIPGDDGPRTTVEVLNGTSVDGLARRLTDELRRHGLDVVSFGSAATPVDSTRILIRRGDSGAALRVREALGTGRITEDLDPRLLLDVTIILGPDAARLDRDP
jgi:hypothetical protein